MGKGKWMNGTHGTYQSKCWEQKRLVLTIHQNEPFSVPDGGDKRDRTADLLNAILEQNYLQYPYFGIIVLISLETKKSQNL